MEDSNKSSDSGQSSINVETEEVATRIDPISELTTHENVVYNNNSINRIDKLNTENSEKEACPSSKCVASVASVADIHHKNKKVVPPSPISVVLIVFDLEISKTVICMSQLTINRIKMPDLSTGSWLGDVIITLITGGTIVSLLQYFSDFLNRRRDRYIELAHKRIEKFSMTEPYYTQIASYYLAISDLIKNGTPGQINYSLVIFYICNIVYLGEDFRRKFGGYIQTLDDLYTEVVVYDLIMYIDRKLQDPALANRMDAESLSRLRLLIDEKKTYQSFMESTAHGKSPDFDKAMRCLNEIENRYQLEEIQRHSSWYGGLIIMEINLMYDVYYGMKNIREYHRKQNTLDLDLSIFLKDNYPDYYHRLCDLKLISSSRFDI